jgi:recombination protein RecR
LYSHIVVTLRPTSKNDMIQHYPSVVLERAVDEFASLPGIGRKTALRLVLHLLSRPNEEVEAFGSVFSTLKTDIHYCKVCHNISDVDVCAICADTKRDAGKICVVENVQDVMAIENTMQYNGLYHVLGGVISPMDGVGPSDLQITSLVERVCAGGVSEVILALSPTMEGDTTNFFISRKLAAAGVKLSVIARGVAVGNNLEYADEVSLGRSIIDRTPFI